MDRSGDDKVRRVPIKEVLPWFRDAGLPRDIRSLQRYCESGLLDGIKELTDTGETWFVAEHSIRSAITQLRQMHEAKGLRPTTTPEITSSSVADGMSPDTGTDNDGPRATASDADGEELSTETPATAATDDDKERYLSDLVVQYEQRIADKDGEIVFYREELKDRGAQIRDMKSIIDGQNQLLGAINQSSERIFSAIARSRHRAIAEPDPSASVHVVDRKESDIGRPQNPVDQVPTPAPRDHRQGTEHMGL